MRWLIATIVGLYGIVEMTGATMNLWYGIFAGVVTFCAFILVTKILDKVIP